MKRKNSINFEENKNKKIKIFHEKKSEDNDEENEYQEDYYSENLNIARNNTQTFTKTIGNNLVNIFYSNDLKELFKKFLKEQEDLINFDGNLGKLIQNPYFFNKVDDYIIKNDKNISNFLKEIKRSNQYEEFDKERAKDILINLGQYFEKWKEKYAKKILSKEEWVTLRPYVEQKILQCDQEIHENVFSNFKNIKCLIQEEYEHLNYKEKNPNKHNPTCFIVYAHPHTDEFPEESWTQEFVLQFVSDLKSVGINAKIDLFHQSSGRNFDSYCIDSIKESDFVIVICTQSFYYAYDEENDILQKQMQVIEKRIKTRKKKNKLNNTIFLSLYPDIEKSIPNFFQSHNMNNSFHTDSYLSQIKNIVKTIYLNNEFSEEKENSYKKIWLDISKKEKSRTLFNGLSHESIKEYYQNLIIIEKKDDSNRKSISKKLVNNLIETEENNFQRKINCQENTLSNLSGNFCNLYQENKHQNVDKNIFFKNELNFFYNSISYYTMDEEQFELLLYDIDLTEDVIIWLEEKDVCQEAWKIIEILNNVEHSSDIEDSIEQYENILEKSNINSEYQSDFRLAIYALMIFKIMFYSDLSLPKNAKAVYEHIVKLSEESGLWQWKTIRSLKRADVFNQETILMISVIIGLSYGHLANLKNDIELHKKCYVIFEELYKNQFKKEPKERPNINPNYPQNCCYLPYLLFIQSIVFDSLAVSLQKIKTYEESNKYFNLAIQSYEKLLDYCVEKSFYIFDEDHKKDQVFFANTIYIHNRRMKYNQLTSHLLYIIQNKEYENLESLIDQFNEYHDTSFAEKKPTRKAIYYHRSNKRFMGKEDTESIILGKNASKKLIQYDKHNLKSLKRVFTIIDVMKERDNIEKNNFSSNNFLIFSQNRKYKNISIEKENINNSNNYFFEKN